MALLLALAAPGCSERREVRYATHLDAVRDGAVLRGWIPPYVPQSAFDLAEVHDLDTGALLLRFRAAPDAIAEMTAGLTPIESKALTPWPRSLAPPRGVPWPSEPWSSANQAPGRAFKAYLGGGDVHCVVIEGAPLAVHLWTCRD